MAKRKSSIYFEGKIGIYCMVCYGEVIITERHHKSQNYPRCPHCLASECGYA